jgi:hypothetical protein
MSVSWTSRDPSVTTSAGCQVEGWAARQTTTSGTPAPGPRPQPIGGTKWAWSCRGRPLPLARRAHHEPPWPASSSAGHRLRVGSTDHDGPIAAVAAGTDSPPRSASSGHSEWGSSNPTTAPCSRSAPPAARSSHAGEDRDPVRSFPTGRHPPMTLRPNADAPPRRAPFRSALRHVRPRTPANRCACSPASAGRQRPE